MNRNSIISMGLMTMLLSGVDIAQGPSLPSKPRAGTIPNPARQSKAEKKRAKRQARNLRAKA